MNCIRAKWAGLALAVVALAGCGGRAGDGEADAAADGAPAGAAPVLVAGGSGLRWRSETYREFDGDEENAERLVATVSKGPLDSTMVRLEVRTSKDRILYRHEWPAVSYMQYGEVGSSADSAAVLRETERQLGRIFTDSAFISGSAAPGYLGRTDADVEAIRRDVAEHEYRTAHGLRLFDPLPRASYEEVVTIARGVPAARIQAIASETRDMPAFKYYAGGEETYVVAWSPSEGRMVRIAACC